jgi:hypothetical protein
MIIHRNVLFLFLFLLFAGVTILPRLIWLYRSEKATGIFSFEGRGNALEQFPERFSFMYFFYKKDTIWFKGPPGLKLNEDDTINIRFQPHHPQDARIDNFYGIWLSIVVYGTMPLLVLLVCFIHPHLVPWRSNILLIPRKPFIKIIRQTNALNSYVDLPYIDADK